MFSTVNVVSVPLGGSPGAVALTCGADTWGIPSAETCGAEICGADTCGAETCGVVIVNAETCGADTCGLCSSDTSMFLLVPGGTGAALGTVVKASLFGSGFSMSEVR